MNEERELFYKMTLSVPKTMNKCENAIILTGENRNSWRKPCLKATLFAANPIWSGLGLSPRLWGDGSAATDRLSGSMPGMYGNDPLVWSRSRKRKRLNGTPSHRWNKSS
jgi:hypothetical protein